MLSSLEPEGRVSRVQVESSRRMGWGKVPCGEEVVLEQSERS
jgi:hypothetical protein